MATIVYSNIRDLNTAKESFDNTKYQLLKDAAASIMAQANNVKQVSLSLLCE